ncbi:MAG: LURP-one-related family protein [Oscillospiraceae bacterium]|nr:LURP-one-related family protein [Oscillospiraceae bacterium]
MSIILGLLGKAAQEVAKVVAVDTAINVLDKHTEKNTDALLNKSSSDKILMINTNEHVFLWKDKFDVYDGSRNVKYKVKGELISIKNRLHIYDSNGIKLGTIKEKLISLRSPILSEANPVDYIIEIGGEKLGKVKSTWSFGKLKYKVDFNGWHIEGSVFGGEYKILNDVEEIAVVSSKLFAMDCTYAVTFSDPNNELIVLMLVITLAAINKS